MGEWKTALMSETRETDAKPESWWAIVFRQLRKNRGAMVGLAIIVILVLMAIFAARIAPYDPLAHSRDSLKPPSFKHLMGTDMFGRDLLSRVISGSRISLRIGFISVGIGASVGVFLGLGAGYFGGLLDALLAMFIDTLLAFPGILLAIAMIAVLSPGLTSVMIAVGISSVPTFCRLMRGSVLSLKQKEFIVSARAVGCRSPRIMMRHLLPNAIGPVIVLGTLRLATAILTAAGLGFLGLGAQPPIPEWGIMVSEGREFLRSAWWLVTFPGLAIVVTVMSINLLGDGLRDAMDPRLRT
jgi:peptide/nickel transport system permease protein